jgi:hypothetical protein
MQWSISRITEDTETTDTGLLVELRKAGKDQKDPSPILREQVGVRVLVGSPSRANRGHWEKRISLA